MSRIVGNRSTSWVGVCLIASGPLARGRLIISRALTDDSRIASGVSSVRDSRARVGKSDALPVVGVHDDRGRVVAAEALQRFQELGDERDGALGLLQIGLPALGRISAASSGLPDVAAVAVEDPGGMRQSGMRIDVLALGRTPLLVASEAAQHHGARGGMQPLLDRQRLGASR